MWNLQQQCRLVGSVQICVVGDGVQGKELPFPCSSNTEQPDRLRDFAGGASAPAIQNTNHAARLISVHFPQEHLKSGSSLAMQKRVD
jgi:hypothetical protein